MSERPKVFIGASSEGTEVANQLHVALDKHAACQVWDQGIFEPGGYTLESLVTESSKFDFAILVFSPDDTIESRGAIMNSPRDNVVFELGLFIGLLGRSRTFIICESGSKLKIPSDLAGVTRLQFARSELGLEADLGATAIRLKGVFGKIGSRTRSLESAKAPSPQVTDKQAVVDARVAEFGSGILGLGSEPSLESWYDRIVPQLRQSTYYTTPTYYLDGNLNVVGWNIAFELLFREIAHGILYKHVSEFIARLDNYDGVFTHGKVFSEQVRRGDMPYVDTEYLEYQSSRYGDVRMLKVAAQLHGNEGELEGWAVALLPTSMNWSLFDLDLLQKIRDDKMWSVYSSAYDRILFDFPPYQKLLSDVTSVVGNDAASVIDIGAGTGNSTKALLDRDFRVTSVEFSTGMIDRIRAKGFGATRHTVVKARAESLSQLFPPTTKFDAATMVNVLYGCDDPYACLCGVSGLLPIGGKLGLSTTHATIKLSPLLDSIKKFLVESGRYEAETESYEILRQINEGIEKTIAKRHSSSEYRDMISDAGFEITKFEEFTYEGAVMLVHAIKK